VASEWAMNKAEELIGIFDCTSSKKPLRLAIAAEIDASRKQGLEEAAEMAKAHVDGCQLPPQGSEGRKEYTRGAYDTASKIVGEIRDRIKEKAGKG